MNDTNLNSNSENTDDNQNVDFEIHVQDKSQLHRIYMPFIAGGGIFIATSSDYELRDEITINFFLMEEPDAYFIRGKVVWMNPEAAQGALPKGIGIQFINKESRTLRDKIETYLTGYAGLINKTDTM